MICHIHPEHTHTLWGYSPIFSWIFRYKFLLYTVSLVGDGCLNQKIYSSNTSPYCYVHMKIMNIIIYYPKKPKTTFRLHTDIHLTMRDNIRKWCEQSSQFIRNRVLNKSCCANANQQQRNKNVKCVCSKRLKLVSFYFHTTQTISKT